MISRQALLPFTFYFLPLLMFMYKMLTDCGFSFIKSAKLRTKMFLSTKKLRKFPPHSFFSYFCPKKMRTIM